MATETNTSSNGFLYFIVGVLLVAVIVLGFLFYNGDLGGQSGGEASIERSADALGEAAENVGESAEDAARAANPG